MKHYLLIVCLVCFGSIGCASLKNDTRVDQLVKNDVAIIEAIKDLRKQVKANEEELFELSAIAHPK